MARDFPDQRDRDIIQVLKEDSRASIRAIARKVRMRPSTVHQRMNKLIEKGVIKGFTVRLDSEKMGENITAFLLVSGSLERYMEGDFMQDPRIKEISGITGDHDLLMKCSFADMREFNKFLVEFREKHSANISNTLTMVRVASLKNEA